MSAPVFAGEPQARQPDEPLQSGLAAWLAAHAEALDADPSWAGEVLPQLVRAGVPRIGVPHELGGSGGTVVNAIRCVAQIAEHSLTAAFVLWGHRTYIEYLLHSPNTALRERQLPALLNGQVAGATGLSNAMKYLSNIEPLQMRATRHVGGFSLAGSLPWITNLRREGFVAAAVFDHDDGAPPSIFGVPHDAAGVARSDDLDLIGMRASSTAALTLHGTVLDARDQISDDAPAFVARVRPGFLGLQCGMSLGLARRALAALAQAGAGTRAALQHEADELDARLAAQTSQLLDGVADGRFLTQPAALFELRIALAETVAAAVALEVQASGGRGYLREQQGTARRVREASFIPIVTPSLVQLKAQLAQRRRAAAS